MPKKSGKANRWPCGQCKLSCKTDCVCCESCNVWFHAKCERLSANEMSTLSDNSVYFICTNCCKNDQGNFDYDAALMRLYSSAQKSASEFDAAAKSEQVAARFLTIPPIDESMPCVLPTDCTAMEILKLVRSKQNRRAVCVPVDGNCLFSAASVALSGHTELSKQLRLQTCIELGINIDFHKSVMADQRYDFVSRNFSDACKSTAKNYAYSDAWTIQALSSAIGRQIRIVYPYVNGQFDETARILDSTFKPKDERHRQGISIMWSSTSMPVTGRTWLPNHFVPLVDVADTPIEITLSPKRSPSEWSETPEIETLTASLESDDKSDHELSKQMENMLV